MRENNRGKAVKRKCNREGESCLLSHEGEEEGGANAWRRGNRKHKTVISGDCERIKKEMG